MKSYSTTVVKRGSCCGVGAQEVICDKASILGLVNIAWLACLHILARFTCSTRHPVEQIARVQDSHFLGAEQRGQ